MQPLKVGTLCLVVYAPDFPEYLGQICMVIGVLGSENYRTDLRAPPPYYGVNARRQCLLPLDDKLPPEPASHRRHCPVDRDYTIDYRVRLRAAK